ncbi:hypothetical protein B0H10DRAFT_1956359 [Mycena sp. CBHHK59/15]|nr:hypothetical protein B0H10DRAFT_1956359 [Mycena sp. CBHHK59/15]
MPTPELSAHASRNLTKPVQQPRRRQPQSNATKASRADAFQKRAKKMSDLNARFKEIFAEREEQIVTLAAEFDQTEKYVRHVLENSTNYTKKRATSLKNAITFELSRGDASNLLDIDLKGDAYQAYKNSLSEERKAELIQQLDDHKEGKGRGVRATNKAGAMDAMQTANRSGRVLGDLESRTGVCSVALFSRGSNADAAVPCWVDSNNTHLFFEQVLGIGIHDVLAKMEMWCCSRKKVKAANDLAAVRIQITQEVEAGLGGKRKRKAPVGGSQKATGERDENDGGESKRKKAKTAKTKPKQVAPPPPAHASHAAPDPPLVSEGDPCAGGRQGGGAGGTQRTRPGSGITAGDAGDGALGTEDLGRADGSDEEVMGRAPGPPSVASRGIRGTTGGAKDGGVGEREDGGKGQPFDGNRSRHPLPTHVNQ